METPAGAMAWNSDSGPMSACGVSTPIRARQPHPSGCHMLASGELVTPIVAPARKAGLRAGRNPKAVAGIDLFQHRREPGTMSPDKEAAASVYHHRTTPGGHQPKRRFATIGVMAAEGLSVQVACR